jgi:Matrixin
MTWLRSGVALALATALVSFSPRAFGFCRTVTAPIPADFNQTAGCYSPPGAIPLWWSNECVGFSVQENASKYISLADAEAHSLAAFQRWMGAACPGGGHPSVSVSDEGPVACDQVGYSQIGPNQHVIIFRDTSWPYLNDVYNALALTTVTFDTDTGEIYDADIEVNTFQTPITVSSTPEPGQYDFDSIITHEAGHFLGLAHTPVDTAVMYAFYKPGSDDLTSDDVGGICAIYSPSGTRATEFDAGTAIVPVTVQEGTPCDPTPRHGFGSQCGAPGSPPPTTTSSGCTISTGPGSTRDGGWPMVALLGAAIGVGIARRRRAARVVPMRRVRAMALCSLLALGAAAVGQLAAEREAAASVSIAILFDELVRDSTGAAIVTPYEQKPVWEEGRIITYTHVHADRPVAGTLESEPWIRTMGGTVGRIGQIVDGEPVLTIGKPGLLFLQPDRVSGSGAYVVTGRAQGQFPVVAGAQGAPTFRASSGVGAIVPPPEARATQMAQLRAKAGLAAEAPRATDVLHLRQVEDGVRDVAAAWVRIHGSK